VTPARVVLVSLPALLRDIVAGVLREEPDIVVVETEDDLREAVERLHADAAVVEDETVDPARVADVLRRHPDACLIGVSADGRQAYAYEPRRVLLGGLSPDTLREAVRAGRRRGPST
jgi:DNA-binding NarL/FixJ family response regulator